MRVSPSPCGAVTLILSPLPVPVYICVYRNGVIRNQDWANNPNSMQAGYPYSEDGA